MNKLNDINSQIEKIMEGIENLKERADFNKLRLKESLLEIEKTINLYKSNRDRSVMEYLLKDIFMNQVSASTELESSFNSTIWNASVQSLGRITTLNDLFFELREIFYSDDKS